MARRIDYHDDPNAPKANSLVPSVNVIVTNDAGLAESCRSIHNCGRVPDGVWYEHHVISGNYRLGELQGALLDAQLDRLEAQTATRDANGRYLASRLARLGGIHPQRRPATCTRHSQHLFMLRFDADAFGGPVAWNVKQDYEIFPQWRHRYPPGTMHNTEHVYSLDVLAPVPVRLAPREHLRHEWLPWRAAAARCFSWSNRDAILALPSRLGRNE